ncbi:MAG: SpoIIE family protein phosphatase [Rhodobacteraceae bacterium]|nr:SpoIIE family protein phosphatase [Paracoccaceae bacterium]
MPVVLVVDDSRLQRRILATSLRRWGYGVLEAASGEEALALAARAPVDLVVSDWMMEGMTGLAFCRAFRDLPRESYGYFILLTSKSEADEIALGLDAGADDFLTKPVDAGELRARLVAGERILAMQRELKEQNRLLAATLAELRGVYAALDRDLVEARKLQQSLVRERHRRFGNAALSLLLQPSGQVSGDLVGYLPLGRDRLAFFSVDVAGHGVASAMMAARLAGMLSSATPEGSVALAFGADPAPAPWPPEKVAERLNRHLLEVVQVEQYLTCVYAEADLGSGGLALVQAGHPSPILIRADGGLERLGEGGLPVGLFPAARFERVETRLAPGDRLLVLSDGWSECHAPDGRLLGEEGLEALIRRHADRRGPAFLDHLLWEIARHAVSDHFEDDVSAILYEFDAPAPACP